MRLETRVEGGVTYLDVDGRLVAGDGAPAVEIPRNELLNLLEPTEEPSAALVDEVERLVEAGVRKLVLNFAALKEIDSAGLGEIVRAYVAASKGGATLRLINLGRVGRILNLPWSR
jgi:hypothetical protein